MYDISREAIEYYSIIQTRMEKKRIQILFLIFMPGCEVKIIIFFKKTFLTKRRYYYLFSIRSKHKQLIDSLRECCFDGENVKNVKNFTF